MKRHAYCIIVHNNPDQLNILVDLIDDERNDIYIHVDKDVDIQQFTPPLHHPPSQLPGRPIVGHQIHRE